MHRLKVVIILLVLIAIGYGVFVTFFKSVEDNGAHREAPQVTVALAIERQVQEWNEFSGWLVAVNQVEIRPRVSGTIEGVHFDNGATVSKGDLLFTIDPRPYEAALQAAEARASLAGSNITRAEKLLSEKALPQREYDQRKNDLDVAKSDLVKAQLDLEYTQVRSPIDGKVGRAEITIGNMVVAGPGAPILTTVVSITPIYADFEIDETLFLEYAKTYNQSVAEIPVMLRLDNEKETPRKGRIEAFDNRLNNATGTIRVRAIFDNNDGYLTPGLFARISLGRDILQNRVLVSEQAIGTDQTKKFVLVVGDDNKVVYKKVILGGRSDGLRIVREGLKPGDKIVVKGLQRVHPGQQVKYEVVSMEEKEAPSQQGKPQS